MQTDAAAEKKNINIKNSRKILEFIGSASWNLSRKLLSSSHTSLQSLKMDNDEELPEILAQINDNWNIQNVQHIFDGNTFWIIIVYIFATKYLKSKSYTDLDLVDFDVDSDWDDDFYDDDDDFDAFDDYEDMDYEDSDEDRRKYVTGIFKTLGKKKIRSIIGAF